MDSQFCAYGSRFAYVNVESPSRWAVRAGPAAACSVRLDRSMSKVFFDEIAPFGCIEKVSD